MEWYIFRSVHCYQKSTVPNILFYSVPIPNFVLTTEDVRKKNGVSINTTNESISRSWYFVKSARGITK